MSPIIDCILQLLIFFMLTSSFSGGAINLSLPKAATADVPEPDDIVVSVNSSGDVFIGPEPIALTALIGRLRDELDVSPGRSVAFRGDATIPYRIFVEVMNCVRHAGAGRLRIVHAPRGDRLP